MLLYLFGFNDRRTNIANSYRVAVQLKKTSPIYAGREGNCNVNYNSPKV